MTTGLTVTQINNALEIVNNTNTIPDARKLLALAQGFVETARKLYNASSINSIIEAGEDKNNSHDIAVKAGELKLYAEARLGELIKVEQEAGRLDAGKGGDRRSEFHGYNDVTVKTLADYNLTKQDSFHAQEMAEHKEIIAEIIVDSLDIPTRSAVEKEIKKRENEQNNEQLRNTRPDLPTGKYQVIYADPPWQYSNSGLNGSAEKHYSTLSMDELKNLKDCSERDIKDLSSDNAVLFMWVTSPFLAESFSLFEPWGFEYKTNFVWIKERETYGKLGFYNHGQHEFVLVGIKGSCQPRVNSLIPSVISAPKSKHSAKPESFYETIESMYPGPYVELFAREKREGWESWGNEIER